MNDFDSLAGFRSAVKETLLDAVRQPARDIGLFDPDFEGWPLDDGALLEELSAWARLPGRRLRMLAVSYEGLRRGMPRFTRWRTTWGHVVDARVPEEGSGTWPSAILVDGQRLLRLLDRENFRGDLVVDRARVVHAAGQIDAIWQRGSAGYAPTVLGL